MRIHGVLASEFRRQGTNRYEYYSVDGPHEPSRIIVRDRPLVLADKTSRSIRSKNLMYIPRSIARIFISHMCHHGPIIYLRPQAALPALRTIIVFQTVSAMSPILIVTAIGLLGLYLLKWVSTKRQQAALPPGPPRKPVVGNLGDLPSHTEKAWEYWLKHKDVYGVLLINYLIEVTTDLYFRRSNQLPHRLRSEYYHH